MIESQQIKIKSLDPLTPSERLGYLMKAISTCHSVSLQDGELLASSPDEIALVKFAQSCQYKLVSRDDTSIKINDD